jgi:hypothetical protein
MYVHQGMVKLSHQWLRKRWLDLFESSYSSTLFGFSSTLTRFRAAERTSRSAAVPAISSTARSSARVNRLLAEEPTANVSACMENSIVDLPLPDGPPSRQVLPSAIRSSKRLASGTGGGLRGAANGSDLQDSSIRSEATCERSPQHYRASVEQTIAPVATVVATLAEDPQRLAAFRTELDALIEKWFHHNRVRQSFLMTRALKR